MPLEEIDADYLKGNVVDEFYRKRFEALRSVDLAGCPSL